VTLDDDFNEEDDLRLEVDGLPVVIERSMQDALQNATVAFDPDKGIVVSC